MGIREMMFAIAPAVFAAMLLARCPRLVRRIRVSQIAIYVAILVGLIGGAMTFVSFVAGARVAPFEVAIVVWFAIAARLAWELWSATIGRVGEEYRRLRRRKRRRGQTASIMAAFIRPVRVAAIAVVFVPLFLSIALTHRFKLRDGTDPKTTLGMNYEAVQIAGRDGITLDAWFVPSPGAKRTIVICHGAGASKGNFIWFLTPLAHRGYNLVLFDFRAHGGSGGRLCTYGIHEKNDVLAVVEWSKTAKASQAEKIVGLGSSLGSMALARAAAEDARIDAIVLDSPFTSAREFAHHHLSIVPIVGPAFADGVLWLMSRITQADFLDGGAAEALRRMGSRPAFIVHGSDDVLMPREHSQRLYDVAAGPKEVWFGPGPHSNIITTVPEEYAERLFKWLREVLP